MYICKYIIKYMFLCVTWQNEMLCYRATGYITSLISADIGCALTQVLFNFVIIKYLLISNSSMEGLVIWPLGFRQLSHSSQMPNDALMHGEGLINPYSAGSDFSRQNLTSTDVRFWRLKSIPSQHSHQFPTTSTKKRQDAVRTCTAPWERNRNR